MDHYYFWSEKGSRKKEGSFNQFLDGHEQFSNSKNFWHLFFV